MLKHFAKIILIYNNDFVTRHQFSQIIPAVDKMLKGYTIWLGGPFHPVRVVCPVSDSLGGLSGPFGPSDPAYPSV